MIRMATGSLPVADIAKAVSGAVSSVLTKLQNKDQYDSSGDEFQPRRKKSKKVVNKPKREVLASDDESSRGRRENKSKSKTLPVLPSTFLSRKNAKRSSSKGKDKMFIYDRDIICLPKSYGKSSSIPIPKSRTELAMNGLIGKIRLSSDMTQDDIFDEIRSVFSRPMGNDSMFRFIVLQATGGRSKSLIIPALSDSFSWTASAIVPKNAKVPLYILAKDPLKTAFEERDSENSDCSDDGLPVVDLTTSPRSTPPSLKPSYVKSASSRAIVVPTQKTPSGELDTGSTSYDVYENMLDYDWQNSPTPPPVSPFTSQETESELSLTDVLMLHRRDVLPLSKQDSTRITVRRKFIFEDFLHKLRNGVDLRKHLRIVFIGEPAVDDGGPLREFLYRIIVSIAHNNTLFCGPVNSRVPRHNVVELQKKTFLYVGQIIALSLIHGGPGPQFFSLAVAQYITFGVQKVKATVKDVPDPELRGKIEKIEDVSSESQLQELLAADDFDFLFDLGISKHKVKLDRREDVISSIALHYGVLMVKAELDQILCGLSTTLDALSLIRSHSGVMKPLFVYEERLPPNADTLFDMLTATFSEAGSNAREQEEATVMMWYNFLQMVEGANSSVVVKSTVFTFSLDEILQFTTGMPYEPPLGFVPKPSLGFTKASVFPTANTCGNAIHLPTMHTTLDEFTWHMCFGIKNCAGFGKV